MVAPNEDHFVRVTDAQISARRYKSSFMDECCINAVQLSFITSSILILYLEKFEDNILINVCTICEMLKTKYL